MLAKQYQKEFMLILTFKLLLILALWDMEHLVYSF